MARAGVSIFGSNGFLPDGITATLGRIRSSSIQTASFINGDKEARETGTQRLRFKLNYRRFETYLIPSCVNLFRAYSRFNEELMSQTRISSEVNKTLLSTFNADLN